LPKRMMLNKSVHRWGCFLLCEPAKNAQTSPSEQQKCHPRNIRDFKPFVSLLPVFQMARWQDGNMCCCTGLQDSRLRSELPITSHPSRDGTIQKTTVLVNQVIHDRGSQHEKNGRVLKGCASRVETGSVSCSWPNVREAK
jgi:hypothetical protein